MSQDFKFVHAADIHLDSPLVGLETFDNAPVALIRDATREALKGLVQLCIEEHVAFLLIAGDVYDGDWRSMATGRFFAEQMARLSKAKIPVFLIKGNHDAASLITRELVLPGVHTFDHRKPETALLEDLGVAIHGQSYSRRDVTENLSAKYPAPHDGYFNIGMLHTCATGGMGMHEPYAPCTVEELIRKGYDYWALGHVHQRAILNERPPVVFPGNLQGRHVREPATEGKGATVVEVVGATARSLTHRALDSVRWTHLTIDVTGKATATEIIETVTAEIRAASANCDGRLLATRITLAGACAASLEIHRDPSAFEASLRSQIQEMAQDAWIEELRLRTRSPSIDSAASSFGSLGDLVEFIRNADDSRLVETETRLAALQARIKQSAPELANELGLDHDDLLRSLLPEVEEAILAIAQGLGG